PGAPATEPGVEAETTVPESGIDAEPELTDALVDDLSDDIPAGAAVGDELVILPLDADDSAGQRANATAQAAAVTAPFATHPTPLEPEPLPRRRRGVPWKILLGLLVAAALVVLGILAFNSDMFQRPSYV